MKSVPLCAAELWEKVCLKVNKAVVFIDNPSAEILHWHDSTKETLHNIIEGSRKLQYVIVIATLSPAVHLFSRTGSLDGDESSVFANIEERILEWMGNMNYTVESAQSKAAVIFVDRTMDLTAPCGHHTELLMDKLVHILPRFPGHHNDLKVEMSGLCNVHKRFLSIEAVMEINRQLVEAATKENLPVKLTGKPGRNSANHHHDNKGATEKLILQNYGTDETENPLSHTLDDVLCLLLYVYTMFGEECLNCEEEDNLKTSLTIEPGNMVNPAMSKPFLKQMIDLIFDPSKPELHDINIQSSDSWKYSGPFFKA
ncbi:hypothetical protein KUTeg_022507 [Tegillarca granosa]|uniref:Uncharacterized protein n=1 Tax=Tegillarca granosa TaxID=220873 RepID=A0ABQ9ECK2_TEGGR|nr:hypothetical protein KUTeg_022507 [Tegillarca granosa]